jgi:hypothetical protein
MYKIILVIVAVFLVGCSPRYIVKNQYIPSSHDGFSQCISVYEEEKNMCEQSCRADYQICLDTAYQRAKTIYDDELRKYHISYDDYLFEFRSYKIYKYEFDINYRNLRRDYNYFSNECSEKKSSYTCRRKNELLNSMNVMKRHKLRRPIMPNKPSFDMILRAQQSYCVSDCSCDKSFDIGYESCGGKIISYKYCVENCD